ncbi:type II toxin-antitoxin system Phd/YefM family antitoxin [Polaromonas sp. AER18D-145]|uniref:type II toxin-antitoxin system Phd/YefM family antitoxin n=1 Tax=Polaromonas sp. AER18D-145 TaxID=1977060 RepID=UPI000BBBFCB7|nr:type II toxin-antitoxin system Phd/YefM family antitoxin [Polaromonas sp. AER18D-145]
MRYSTQIKPISYLKANAAQVLRDIAEQREPMVITQNGEATAVIQDIASYENNQETLALLKILALGNQQIEQGRVVPAAEAIARIRQRATKIQRLSRNDEQTGAV